MSLKVKHESALQKGTSDRTRDQGPGLICQSTATKKISLKLTMVKIYIFHSVIIVQPYEIEVKETFSHSFFQFCKLWLTGGRNFSIFPQIYFTSEVFVDNGEPAKFKLILKYFFLSQHNPIVSFAGSLRRKFFNCPLKFKAFIFAMWKFWFTEA